MAEVLTIGKGSVSAQAMIWDGSDECADSILEWIDENDVGAAWHAGNQGCCGDAEEAHLVIDVLDGNWYAHPGFWVIRDAEGRFSVCDPAEAAETYDIMEGQQQ